MDDTVSDRRLILGRDNPKGVLVLPDSGCQVKLRHVPATGDVPTDVKLSPERRARQWWRVRADLRSILTDSFSAIELRNLCFDLGVDHENLPGEGKLDMARELLACLERIGRIPELLEFLKLKHPDIFEAIPPGLIEMAQVCSRKSPSSSRRSSMGQ